MRSGPLRHRRVVVTREEPGRLAALLADAGADVVHVPLIEVVEPADGGAELRQALAQLDGVDWVVVTSRHGAERVGPTLRSAPDVALAAVGRRTAEVLADAAGRAVDVVPARQTAADLVAAMPRAGSRALIAQADRADESLAAGLRSIGYGVDVVTAYRTRLRRPTDAERRAALQSDAVAFASGSAVEGWVQAFGDAGPPIVAVIGPSTAAAAEQFGVVATHVAVDHDVDGLAAVLIDALTDDAV